MRELNYVVKAEDDADSSIKTKTKYLCKISECKVKAIARELERLLPYAGGAREATLQLIVPHIVQIMEEPYSAVLAVWYLFDPIAKSVSRESFWRSCTTRLFSSFSFLFLIAER